MSELIEQVANHEGVDKDEAARLVRRTNEIFERRKKALENRISPKGALGLDKCLDAARLEHAIPDTAFDMHATFKTVLVLQVSMQKGDTYKDSAIILTEAHKDRELRRAPLGIIVSAGLQALDILRSHGIDLGHKVMYVHSAPYFVRYDTIAGSDQHLVVLDVSQIRASFDMANNLKARRLRIVKNPEDLSQHVLKDEDGKYLVPQEVES